MAKVTNLTACSWGEGRIDVFGVDRDTGNILQLLFENGSWANPNVIPNPFQGTRFQGYITACSWGKGRIDIFGADSEGQLLQYYYGGIVLPTWNAKILGHQGLTGQMTACSWGEERIDIFGLNATQDRMIQYYYDGSWEGPVSHDYTQVIKAKLIYGTFKPFAQTITSASWGSGRIDIFGQDSSGKMEQLYYDGSWGGSILDPTTTTAISACAPRSGHVDTFSLDSNCNILHVYYNGIWKSETVDNPFPSQNWTLQAASSWGKGRIDLFGLDEAGKWLHVVHDWVPEDLPGVS